MRGGGNEEKKEYRENLFKEILSENLPKLTKLSKLDFENLKTPNRISASASLARQITIKTMIARDKRKKIPECSKRQMTRTRSPSEMILTADVSSETMEVGGSGMTHSE